jgi:tripeptide aminopeptidase
MPANSQSKPTQRKTSKANAGKRKSRLPDPIKLVMEMMAIRGKSGDEGQIAEFIKSRLLDAGLPASNIKFDTAHKKTPIDGQQGNLIVKLPGTVKGDRRLLMAHMDTVPLCQGSKPVRKGNLVRSSDPQTALGGDDRAGCAVLLYTLLRLLQQKTDHPPLTFLWTVQEEIGLHGARNVKLGLLGKPKLAFNWDGGAAERVTIGATGGYKLDVQVHGIASHAGNRPEAGVSAIAIASMAIADLQKNGWHGLVKKGNKLGTSNIGLIQGGEATNVVTDYVHLRGEARSHNATFRKKILTEMEKAFKNAAKQLTNDQCQRGKVELSSQLNYESFKLKPTEPCVRAAKAAVVQSGGTPNLYVVNGGLDANWMSAHGIPTVTMGCGQSNIHMVTEVLELKEYETALGIAFALATATEEHPK